MTTECTPTKSLRTRIGSLRWQSQEKLRLLAEQVIHSCRAGPGVNRRSLLGKHPRAHAADLDLRTKAGGIEPTWTFGAANQVDRGSWSDWTTTA